MYRVFDCITQNHTPYLLLPAVLVCLLAMLVAIGLARRAGASEGRRCAAWLASAGIAMGTGVWSTHYIAMLAYDPGLPVVFSPALTLASIGVAIAATTAGFAAAVILSGARAHLFGGALAGLGVAAMHFMGSQSMLVQARMEWDAGLVHAAIATGTALSAIGFRLALRRSGTRSLLLGGGVLVLAVCGLHFIATAALEFRFDPTMPAPPSVGFDWLAVGLICATMLLLAIFVLGSLEAGLAAARKQALERFQQLSDATFEGLALVTGGRILNANEPLARLAGLPLDALIGRPVSRILPGQDLDRLARLTRNGRGEPVEVRLERPDGSTVDVEVLARNTRSGDAITCVVAMRDLTERRKAEEQITRLTHRDALTGLPNRTLFLDQLQKAMREARRRNATVALLLIDVRRLGEINRTFGHTSGDLVLRSLAESLTQSAAPGDMVARMGNDAFAVIQTGALQPLAVHDLASRITARLAETAILGDDTVGQVSLGTAIYPWDANTSDTLVANAMTAMRRSAAGEPGTLRFYEIAMDVGKKARTALERDLRRALMEGRLSLAYQPQIDLVTGAVRGFEALLRWNDAARGFVSPADFIPVAEESGLILPIGAFVLREAAREAAGWPEPLRVAVNLSPRQFASADLEATIEAALSEAGLPAERLEIEITEGSVITDVERAREIMQRLKDRGLKLAIDDFGTGYSSLSYLRDFPFDTIKIDRSFIIDIDTRTETLAIARAIMALARALGLTVVAEGVESEAQLDLLRGEGCDEVQGYVFSRPLAADAIPQFLAAHLARMVELASLGGADPKAPSWPAEERLLRVSSR